MKKCKYCGKSCNDILLHIGTYHPEKYGWSGND